MTRLPWWPPARCTPRALPRWVVVCENPAIARRSALIRPRYRGGPRLGRGLRYRVAEAEMFFARPDARACAFEGLP